MINVDELVRQVYRDPGPPVPDAWEERKDRYYAEICGGVRRRHRRRRAAARGALPSLVLVVVVLAVVVPQVVAAPPSSAAVLDAAAAAVAAQPLVVLHPGQYRYMVTHSLYQVTVYQEEASGRTARAVATATYTESEQVWSGVRGGGRYVLARGPLQFASAADAAAWRASPLALTWESQHLQPVEEGNDPGAVTTDVARLPTGVGALRARITRGDTGTDVDFVPGGPDAVFERAADLLVTPDLGMTPALESALYRVLAAQPGVTVATGASGPGGDHGTALSISGAAPGAVRRLLVDPGNGTPLVVESAPPAPTQALAAGSAPVCVDGTCTRTPSGGRLSVVALWTAQATTTVVGSDTATSPVVAR